MGEAPLTTPLSPLSSGAAGLLERVEGGQLETTAGQMARRRLCMPNYKNHKAYFFMTALMS